jgi:hypothetical protein
MMNANRARRPRFVTVSKLALVAVVAGIAAPSVAGASEPTTAACYDAHEAGQVARKRDEIHKARASFAACGQSACPPIVQRDCVAWAAELAELQPSVVLAVVRGDGSDVLGASVSIDGSPVEADGRGVELDPGEHHVRVERADGAPFEQSFAVREGDHARRLEIVLPDPTPSRGLGKPPLVSYVLGGVALVSAASFGTFAWLGKSRENELTDACGNRCGDEEVASVRRSYLAADISLGVTVAALGAAVITWLIAPRAPERPARSAAR